MKQAAIFISGLDVFGSTDGQWSDMIAALPQYEPFVCTWNDCKMPQEFADYETLMVIGHSFGGHEAWEFCARANRQVDGLVLLDAVWQENIVSQFFAGSFDVPGNVRWPISIKRRSIWPPYSKGFDERQYNEYADCDHEDFPRDPDVIARVVEFLKDKGLVTV